MWWITKTIIYQTVLLIAAISGLIHFTKMDKASKIIVTIIISTFVFEAAAVIASIVYKNSIPIYHLYTPIQLLLISVYFNFSIEKFRDKNIGLIIGVIGVAISICNSIFFQHPQKDFNTNFLIIESFLVIGMCLYSFYDLLLGDIGQLFAGPRFWHTSLLLIFWSFTFCYWLVWHALYKATANNFLWLSIMIWTINVLCYSGFAIVFLSFRKMKKV